MNTNLKHNLIGGGIAAVIILSLVTWGYTNVKAARSDSEPKVTNELQTAQTSAPVVETLKPRFEQYSTEGNAIAALAEYHAFFNNKVGYGNDKEYKKVDADVWTTILNEDALNPDTYRKLGETLASVQGFEIDMQNLSDLATIAHEKHDPQALIYMHRVLHDLDYWAFEGGGSKTDTHWMISNVVRDADLNIESLMNYIAKNK